MKADAVTVDRLCESSLTACVLSPPAAYSQVKQKSYSTSKFLLFKVIFRLQHQGNEERVFLL